MFRILALTVPVLLCFVGIVGLFHFQGVTGVLIAFSLVGIGGGTLWWIEKKTIHHLEQDTWWTRIINKDEDGYG